MMALEIKLPSLNERGEFEIWDDLVYPPYDKGRKCIIAYGKFRGYFAFPSYLGREEVKRRMKKAGYKRFKLRHTRTYACCRRRRRSRR